MKTLDPTLRALNDCECCEGISVETPAGIQNRPGLSAIAYRIGTHSRFKESLLAELSRSKQPSLVPLTTRSDDDFTIGLLDAFSAVADVLTFYQERIANECYLRTANERLSILELARLIGYQLRPGVTANTFLAFTIEDTPGALGQAINVTANSTKLPQQAQMPLEPTPEITIDVGTKVQSIPGPDEKAQTFETIEKIKARAEWNTMRPRLTERHPIKGNAKILFFSGFTTGLSKGDGLILFPDDGKEPIFRRVAEVILNDSLKRSEVRLQPLSDPVQAGNALIPEWKYTPGPILKNIMLSAKPINAGELFILSVINKIELKDVFSHVKAIEPIPPTVLALRTRAAIFGHNAPRFDQLPLSLRFGEYVGPDTNGAYTFKPGPYYGRNYDWVEKTLAGYPDPHNQEPANTKNIYLDTVYPGIVKSSDSNQTDKKEDVKSYVVLKDGSFSRIYEVENVAEVSKSDFTLTAKVSRLTLNDRSHFGSFEIRNTTVFGQSEPLTLDPLVIKEPVKGRVLQLDSLVEGLFEGQKVIVSGENHENRGDWASEVGEINAVEQVLNTESYTIITLKSKLTRSYVRDTVTINANVALASHGETVQEEVLGGGDASQPFQKFVLRQPPLTYVSSDDPTGAATTLEIRVNGILWKEVPMFYGHGPDERVYVTSLDNAGNTTVIFGDGKTGARLPTGQENVKAKYRKGIGTPGLVKANQISQLMTRPLGVKAATNPLEPSGAEDPEKLNHARRNAPLTVLTLGRVVSLQDYEDYARSFQGIAKALATWVWKGEKRHIVLTVAGPDGGEIAGDSSVYKNLISSLHKFGDPAVPLSLLSYDQRFFRISVAVKINPDYQGEKVLAAVRHKLRNQFSFDARDFGQPIHRSEIDALIHRIPGVVAIDINEFYGSENSPDLKPRLEARIPRLGGKKIFPAQLLVLDPRPLNLSVMS